MGHSILAKPRKFCADAILGALQMHLSQAMRARGILVRDRSSDPGCEDCVRITVGIASTTDGCSRRCARCSTEIGNAPKGGAHEKAAIERTTKETNIRCRLVIEGHGRYKISTGIRFFDHMLELFAHHGGFDLELKAKGDLDVDQHHTVEDVGIVLGQAFRKALGNKRGILRAGYFVMPMDETLGLAAVDFSGRTPLRCDTKVRVAAGGRSASGVGARFLRRLCARR